MEGWPYFIEYALNWLFDPPITGEREEFVRTFVRRWDDLDLDTMARVVQEGDGQDRLFALLALGGTRTAEARETLLPLLGSADPTERQVSALELGKMREPRALPTLLGMLAEFQPPDAHDVELAFSEPWLYPVPGILGRWGEPSAVPPLRAALQKAVQAELAVPEPEPQERVVEGKRIVAHRHSERDSWNYFQDEIVYALGRLGAFGALTGLSGADEHLDLWRVHLLMGHLHGRYEIQGAVKWHELPDLLEEVTRLLERCFGLNAEEQKRCLKRYQIEKTGQISSIYRKERLGIER